MARHRLRNVLLAVLVGILLASAVIIDNVASPWKERAKIAQMLLLLGLVAYAVAATYYLRRTSGKVLLELPHPWPGIRIIQVLVAVLGIGAAILCFAFLPKGLEAALAQALTGLLLVSVAVWLIIAALSPLRFTEGGVFSPSGYVAWKDVATYRWEGKDGQQLRLIPGRWLPFFAPMPWAIPNGQKPAVDEILARHVATASLPR
jgi:hypothetical protein